MMNIRGVSFGGYHTAMDGGAILNAKTIGLPKPKSNMVKIDGRDGDLDLTEAISGVTRYENRKLTFTFLFVDGTHEERETKIAELVGRVHGKRLKIILDDDPEFYFVGRCSVTDTPINKAYGTVKIEVDAEPYRYSIREKGRAIDVITYRHRQYVFINNGTRAEIPTITITGKVYIMFGSYIKTLTEGTYYTPDFKFEPGKNIVTIYGAGTIKISYQEAKI